jgi:hypothetical protein
VPSKSYFQLVEHPIQAGDIANIVYLDPSRDSVKQFEQLNAISKPSDMLYPGHFILVPSLDGLHDDDVPGARAISEVCNFEARHAVGRADPRLLNENFTLLDVISSNKSEIATTSKIMKASSEYAKSQLKEIEKTFGKLNETYKLALSKRINLSSNEFSRLRAPVEAQLRSQMVGLSKSSILKRAEVPSMKDALGISHRSLMKSFRASGSAGDVKEITRAVSRTKDLSAVAGKVGKVAKVLSIGTAVATTATDFRDKGATEGFRTMSREAGGIAGGTAGGTYGASLGGTAATAALLAFGVGTGGLGFVAIGIGVAAGAVIGGYVGSEAGKAAVDGTTFVLDKATEQAVDWIID